MGRKKTRKIKKNPFGECLLCDYKSKSMKGLELHMKYSHLKDPSTIKKNEEKIVVCGMCGKKECKIHL